MGRKGPHNEYLPDRREIERMTAKFRKERDANDERESIHELIAGEFDDDDGDSLLQFDDSTSYVMPASIPAVDLHEMAETMRRFKREAEDIRASMRAAIDEMEPCGICGRRVRYWPGPPEAIFVCVCVRERLRAIGRGEDDPTTLPLPFPPLFGISVEVYP